MTTDVEGELKYYFSSRWLTCYKIFLYVQKSLSKFLVTYYTIDILINASSHQKGLNLFIHPFPLFFEWDCRNIKAQIFFNLDKVKMVALKKSYIFVRFVFQRQIQTPK